jgi:peptidyl-tRNA hydrolase
MSAGKMAAQSGHAFLSSFLKAPSDIQTAYVADEGGTKVVLACPDEATIWQAFKLATDAGLPCHLWVENDMGPEAVVTALGIGPADRSKIKPIVKDMKLMA